MSRITYQQYKEAKIIVNNYDYACGIIDAYESRKEVTLGDLYELCKKDNIISKDGHNFYETKYGLIPSRLYNGIDALLDKYADCPIIDFPRVELLKLRNISHWSIKYFDEIVSNISKL